MDGFNTLLFPVIEFPKRIAWYLGFHYLLLILYLHSELQYVLQTNKVTGEDLLKKNIYQNVHQALL